MAESGASPEAGGKKRRFFYGYIIVLAGMFILTVTNGIMYSFGVFLKPLSAEFGWTRAMTSGAYSLSLVMLAFFYMVTGRLTDRLGPRLVITTCGLFLGLGYLLMSQANALWHVYLIYGLIVAAGMSGGFVPLTSTVARWFVKRRGVMTGIVVSGAGLGTVVMPPTASWLIVNQGWRSAYIVVGVAALAVVVAMAQLLRRDPGKMGLLPYGETRHAGGEAKTEGQVSEVRGFSLREAARTRQFWMFCVMHFCLGFNIHGIMVHIVPHATDAGIPAVVASNILVLIGGLNIGSRVIIGGVSDRVGTRRALVTGFAVLVIALILLQFARELWMLYLFAIVFGFGYGGLVAVQSPIIAEFFGLKAHGAILGIIVFNVIIGGAIGSLLAGRIFDVRGDYHLAFLLCLILGVIGLTLAVFLKRLIRV